MKRPKRDFLSVLKHKANKSRFLLEAMTVWKDVHLPFTKMKKEKSTTSHASHWHVEKTMLQSNHEIRLMLTSSHPSDYFDYSKFGAQIDCLPQNRCSVLIGGRSNRRATKTTPVASSANIDSFKRRCSVLFLLPVVIGPFFVHPSSIDSFCFSHKFCSCHKQQSSSENTQ